ncbi:MAG: penicillin-binding protein 1A [Salinisphaeraceae bacterium]|nr:penicillin-binding protein 1A [Salinisphaeraceae bacterium]
MPSSRLLPRLLLIGAALLFTGLTAAAIGLGAAYLYYDAQLPDASELETPSLDVPLRIYSEDGLLIAEYGVERRKPLTYEQIPQVAVQAFLAAEDDRFFYHPGVDYQGLIRAAFILLTTGEKTQGGSTITMQLARNLFLSNEKSYTRKIKEILLALRLEAQYSKTEILTLYLNKIYMGHRAYGVATAARVYYGKDLAELDLAQTAMIAGLPKAPSNYNPITNPSRAQLRRNYVLRRMHELDFISEEELKAAQQEPVTAQLQAMQPELEAGYVAEMVRARMVEEFGEAAYTQGYRVFTTLNSSAQKAANRGLQRALLEYDQRHGWRKPNKNLDSAALDSPESADAALRKLPRIEGLQTVVVMQAAPNQLTVYNSELNAVELSGKALEWAQKSQSQQALAQRGDIVHLQATGSEKSPWRIAQVPEVQGALVALNPRNGAIVAMVGGFDYSLSKFNRVTQAERQPGSIFKPFLYSAALDNGFTPASIINDAPVVFDDPRLGQDWRPENYSGRIYGPTRLREALIKSRNLVSIRLMQAVGINTARQHAARFGLPLARMPKDLSLSLGTATFTPLEIARGFAVFANGGHLVNPYFIKEIRDADDEILFETKPLQVCSDCLPEEQAPRVISAQNAFLMTDIMQDVVRRGTARRAMQLGREDLAGKTGTTNDTNDAWFSGYNAELVASAWVGFDQLQSLGRVETGGRAALPMWMYFMGDVLKGTPPAQPQRPPGLVTVRINPETGKLVNGYVPDAMFETFYADQLPEVELTTPLIDENEEVVEDLF